MAELELCTHPLRRGGWGVVTDSLTETDHGRGDVIYPKEFKLMLFKADGMYDGSLKNQQMSTAQKTLSRFWIFALTLDIPTT